MTDPIIRSNLLGFFSCIMLFVLPCLGFEWLNIALLSVEGYSDYGINDAFNL